MTNLNDLKKFTLPPEEPEPEYVAIDFDTDKYDLNGPKQPTPQDDSLETVQVIADAMAEAMGFVWYRSDDMWGNHTTHTMCTPEEMIHRALKVKVAIEKLYIKRSEVRDTFDKYHVSGHPSVQNILKILGL